MKNIPGFPGKGCNPATRHPVSDSPKMVPDVLSGILDTIRFRSVVAGLSTFSAPWGIRIPPGPSGFFVIMHGQCWFEPDDSSSPILLNGGDLVLNIQGLGHCLRDDPQSPVVSIDTILTADQIQKRQGITLGGGGAATSLIAGCFLFDQDEDIPLLTALPRILHIHGDNGRLVPWLDDMLRLITGASAPNQSGGLAVVNHLANIIFIQAIRTHVSALPPNGGNWLAAMADRDIGPSLGLIHSRPEAQWSVASLAREVGMSRSAFAGKFTRMVGQSPMKYLMQCRINKARNLLRESQNSLKEIALRVGYGSEAAFSNAFKRWTNVSPGRYRMSRGCTNESRLTKATPSPVPRRGSSCP
jgi:AraC family transcriptional regulator, alkane utilization regulator